MTDHSTDLDLGTRAGLPEALRVLSAAHPRETWRSHANFDGLTAFWLERHLGFRRLLTRIGEETQSSLQDAIEPARFATSLHRNASLFVGELHMHHNVEDMHYFPQLAQRDPRLARGFELLDRDHGVLEGELGRFTEDTEALLRTLQAGPMDRDMLGRYRDQVSAFERLLNRHLLDEEDLVVPVILEHPWLF